MIADTAHQLRTPLANMESYLELLETMDWEEKERENYLLALRESQEKIRFLTRRADQNGQAGKPDHSDPEGSPGSSGDSSGKYPSGKKRGRGKTYRDPPGDEGGRTDAP